MSDKEETRMARNKNLAWLTYALIALIFEKTIQHIVVIIAFYFNVNNLGAIFAVTPRLLMTVGAAVTILFALSLWGMVAKRNGRSILLSL
jgi:uncharacterized membrane protein